MNYTDIHPGTLLAPVPAVLVTCVNESGVPNALAVAWTGIICSKPPMLSISIKKERYSHGLILRNKCFTVNLVSRKLLPAMDTCGVISGANVNKFEACGMKAIYPDKAFSSPVIDGAPLYLNCRVTAVQALGSHDLFMAKIEKIGVRSDLIDSRGRIMMEKADLIAYSHGVYYGLSEALGFFGYTVASPETLKKRMDELYTRHHS